MVSDCQTLVHLFIFRMAVVEIVFDIITQICLFNALLLRSTSLNGLCQNTHRHVARPEQHGLIPSLLFIFLVF